MPATKNYNIAKVAVNVEGFPVTGFGSGDAVRITTQPQYSTQVGVDGSASRSKSNNKSATIEINLMQTSASNAILKSFATIDDSSGLGVFLLTIIDLNGGSTFTCTAWIEKEPDYAFGGEAQEWTWVLGTGNLTSAPLGNNDISNA